MPQALTAGCWANTLSTSTAVVILLVLFFPLDAVGQMTSLAFLVVYGAGSAAVGLPVGVRSRVRPSACVDRQLR
jgi:hypothetical protein